MNRVAVVAVVALMSCRGPADPVGRSQRAVGPALAPTLAPPPADSAASAVPVEVIGALRALFEATLAAQTKGANRALADLDGGPRFPDPWVDPLIAAEAVSAVRSSLDDLDQYLLAVVATDASQLDRVGGLMRTAVEAARELEAGGPYMAGQRTLLAAYRTEIDSTLVIAETRASTQLAIAGDQLLASLGALPPALLGTVRQQLASADDFLAHVEQHQYEDVMLGWLRACGRVAMDPRLPTALHASERDRDGVVDVVLGCEGTAGCVVERVTVNAHAAARRVIEARPEPLLTLPIYRKVFIHPRGHGIGAGFATLAFVLLPPGKVVDVPGAMISMETKADVLEVLREPR